MSPESYALLGVIIGAIIGQLGNIISYFTAKKNDRKAVFEARFKKAEEFMEVIINKMHNFNIELTGTTKYIKLSDRGKWLDRFDEFIPAWSESRIYLYALSITNDREFLELIEEIHSKFKDYRGLLISNLSTPTVLSDELSKCFSSLLNTYSDIIEKIDFFRLNNYKS